MNRLRAVFLWGNLRNLLYTDEEVRSYAVIR